MNQPEDQYTPLVDVKERGEAENPSLPNQLLTSDRTPPNSEQYKTLQNTAIDCPHVRIQAHWKGAGGGSFPKK